MKYSKRDVVLHRYQINCFLGRDAFVRTNRRAIAMMFVHLSICLSVWDGGRAL